MKTRRNILTAMAAVLALGLAAPLPVQAEDAPLNVTVAILPLSSIAEAIGGEHVAVTVMVPPGTSPKVFEPKPSQMAALASADIYVSMGLSPEKNWTPQVAAARPDMPLLTMTDLVQTRMIDGSQQTGADPRPETRHAYLAWPRPVAQHWRCTA